MIKTELVPKNYLLIIGIDRYRSAAPLFNAVADARKFKEILIEKYQFERENCIELYDEKASGENIQNAFAQLIGKVKSNDSLVIYYAGHGAYDQNFDAGYWLPVDAVVGQLRSYISNYDLIHWISRIQSLHTVLFSDSCFSGVLFSNYRGFAEKVEKIPSRYAITSGRNELVEDGPAGYQSPFARSIFRLLANNKDRPIPVSELGQYVKSIVGNNTKQTPLANPIKNVGDHGGEFVFWPQKSEYQKGDENNDLNFGKPSLPKLKEQTPPTKPKKKNLRKFFSWAAYFLSVGIVIPILLIWYFEIYDPSDWSYSHIQEGCYNNRIAHCGDMVSRVQFFKNDEYLISSGYLTKEIKFWYINGDLVHIHRGGWSSLVAKVSPDGQYFVNHVGDSVLGIFQIRKVQDNFFRSDSFHLVAEIKNMDKIEEVSFSPDMKYLALGGYNNTLTLWELGNIEGKDGEDSSFVPLKANGGHKKLTPRILWQVYGDDPNRLGETGVVSVDFSDRNNLIAIGIAGGSLAVFDFAGDLVFRKKVFPQMANPVRFTPDGQSIVVGSNGPEVKFYSFEGKFQREFEAGTGAITSFEFSPDGTKMIVGNFDHKARVFDILGNQLRVIRGHHDAVRAVDWSNDGKWILTGGDDGTVRKWSTE